MESGKPKSFPPPSVRAERELRRRLDAGQFGPPGTQLPSTDRLAEEIGVSRGTVATVLKKLAAEGLVTVIRGYGSFVGAEDEDEDSA